MFWGRESQTLNSRGVFFKVCKREDDEGLTRSTKSSLRGEKEDKRGEGEGTGKGGERDPKVFMEKKSKKEDLRKYELRRETGC